MSEPTKIKWRIAGEEFASCNCNWGCPCQFNAPPTTGRCEAFVTCLITDGYFAHTRLDGVVFSRIYWWPRAIHEGNGVQRMIIDEQAAKEQRDALIAIESGEEHRARIVLPDGFEYEEAEMGNTVFCRVGAGGQLAFELKNTYGQLNAFDWSN
jgi:hypothetical protein